MKFKAYLQEDYVGRISGTHSSKYSGNSSVFVNPDRKELRDLKESVRFIINFTTKCLFVWDWDIVHYEVAKFLSKEQLIPSNDLNHHYFWKSCMAGVADNYKSKLEFTDVSDYGKYVTRDTLHWAEDSDNDKWLERWFGKGFIIDVLDNERWLDSDQSSQSEPEPDNSYSSEPSYRHTSTSEPSYHPTSTAPPTSWRIPFKKIGRPDTKTTTKPQTHGTFQSGYGEGGAHRQRKLPGLMRSVDRKKK